MIMIIMMNLFQVKHIKKEKIKIEDFNLVIDIKKTTLEVIMIKKIIKKILLEKKLKEIKVNQNTKKKKNLEKLIENKKIGLEKLKKKLKNFENENLDEENIDEDLKEEELDLFELDSKQGNKKQTIVFRTNNLNSLEFEVPVKDRNLKDLKNVKKIKYLVNGYLVLNVKKKQLIYDN